MNMLQEVIGGEGKETPDSERTGSHPAPSSVSLGGHLQIKLAASWAVM